jgi:predicted lipid-binding transport protein (Tim44 family)
MAVATAPGYARVSYTAIGIGLIVLAFILLGIGFFLGILTAAGIVLAILFVIFLAIGLYVLFMGTSRPGFARRRSTATQSSGVYTTQTTPTVVQPATTPAAAPAPAPVQPAGAVQTPVAPTAGVQQTAANVRYCPACGAPVTAAGTYCASCGRALP